MEVLNLKLSKSYLNAYKFENRLFRRLRFLLFLSGFWFKMHQLLQVCQGKFLIIKSCQKTFF